MLKRNLYILTVTMLLALSGQVMAGGNCVDYTDVPKFDEPNNGKITVTAGTVFTSDLPSNIEYTPSSQTAHQFILKKDKDNVPSWATIDDQTGVVTISPPANTAPGDYKIKIQLELQCDNGKKDNNKFKITIVAPTGPALGCTITAPSSVILSASSSNTFLYRVEDTNGNATGIIASIGTPAATLGIAAIDTINVFTFDSGTNTGSGDSVILSAICPNSISATKTVSVTVTNAPLPDCEILVNPSTIDSIAGEVTTGGYQVTNGGDLPTISAGSAYGSEQVADATTISYGTNANTAAPTDQFTLSSVCPNGQSTSAIVNINIQSATPNCEFSVTSPLQVSLNAVVTSIYTSKSLIGGPAPTPTVSVLPVVGSATIDSSTQFSYQYNNSAPLGATDSFYLSVTCPNGVVLAYPVDVSQPNVPTINPDVPDLRVEAGISGTSGTVYADGAVIIDNTPNPGTPGISTNMRIEGVNTAGTNCTSTKQYGVCNSFSQAAIQVMQRVSFEPTLIDHVGLLDTTCDGSCDLDNHCVGNRLDPTSGLDFLPTQPAAGTCSSVSTANQADASRRTTYFANGNHLFDLDRLRAAADYLYDYRLVTNKSQAGIAFTATHPEGSFGTISWAQFLANIANKQTMYGMTRVLIPLQLGTAATYKSPGGSEPSDIKETCSNADPNTPDLLYMSAQYNTVKQDSVGNILRDTTTGDALINKECVSAGSLFGFCDHTAPNSMCGSSTLDGGPTDKGNTSPGAQGPTLGDGNVIPAAGAIKVKGSLMYDFVSDDDYPSSNNPAMTGSTNNHAYTKGEPIKLDHLHFNAKSYTYIKIELPIMVNWANDDCTNAHDTIFDVTNYPLIDPYNCGQGPDGILDNIDYINSITGNTPITPGIYGVFSPPEIEFAHVPQDSKDAFQQQFGKPLDTNEWALQSPANRYHLLMGSGYAQGWADAFGELGITSTLWKSIPLTPAFQAPDAAAPDGILTVNEIRSEAFEDIPSYLYSGGLVDMHRNLNLSGLMYVPQSLELEARRSANGEDTARQYVMGAIIMRDGFFIESNPGTITLISSYPSSFSNIRVDQNANVNTFNASSTGSGGSAVGWVGLGGGTTDPGTDCFGCGPGPTNSEIAPGRNQWIQIHPQQ